MHNVAGLTDQSSQWIILCIRLGADERSFFGFSSILVEPLIPHFRDTFHVPTGHEAIPSRPTQKSVRLTQSSTIVATLPSIRCRPQSVERRYQQLPSRSVNKKHSSEGCELVSRKATGYRWRGVTKRCGQRFFTSPLAKNQHVVSIYDQTHSNPQEIDYTAFAKTLVEFLKRLRMLLIGHITNELTNDINKIGSKVSPLDQGLKFQSNYCLRAAPAFRTLCAFHTTVISYVGLLVYCSSFNPVAISNDVACSTASLELGFT